MDQFFGPIDYEDKTFHPWETQVIAEHRLTGEDVATGEKVVIEFDTAAWAATQEDASKVSTIAFFEFLKGAPETLS